jgi:hypothetical protein
MVFIQKNIFWKKNIHNNLQSRTIFWPYKKFVTKKRTYVNVGCILLNPYVLRVLLSIPFNKLPWPNVEILAHKLRQVRKSLMPHQTPPKFPSFAQKICLPKNKRNEWNISKRDPYVEKTTKNVWHWSFFGLWLLHNLETLLFYKIEP